VNSITALNPRQ